MNIAMITPEAVPFAKTGGLAEVTTSLSLELEKLGHNVVMVMPFYKVIKDNKDIKVKMLDTIVSAWFLNRQSEGRVYYANIGKYLLVYFIENDEFFNREGLYGTYQGDYVDNGFRFGFFAKAVINLLPKIGFQPDIIHVHDWQTSLIPLLLKTVEKGNDFYKSTKTILTIHNIAYQGLVPTQMVPELGLSWDVYNPFTGIEFYGNVNYLKAGIVSADVITTLSGKYSKEIQSDDHGFGLSGTLRGRNKNLYGVPVGVNYSRWNPSTDEYIKAKFDVDNFDGRHKCRQDLLKEFELSARDNVPIIGVIARLVDVKGADILLKSLNGLSELNLRLVLLGVGDDKYLKLFGEAKELYSSWMGAKFAVSAPIAHQIVAGSDMFLMPSKIEPMGQYQMYAMRYGSVPIVRATGSLDDTIIEYNPKIGKGTGFKFSEYSSEALINAVKKAVKLFKDKAEWQKILRNAMIQNFSWQKCAEGFEEMYKKVKS